MVGALTKQLVNALSIFLAEIEEEFRRAEREVGGRGLQLREALKLLERAIAPGKRTFIFLDALDECSDKHLSQLLTSLHTVFQTLPGIRIFITRRPHVLSTVEKYLPGSIKVVRFSLSNEDIGEYLERKLKDDLDSEEMNPALKVDIMERIPEKIPDQYVMSNSISEAATNH